MELSYNAPRGHFGIFTGQFGPRGYFVWTILVSQTLCHTPAMFYHINRFPNVKKPSYVNSVPYVISIIFKMNKTKDWALVHERELLVF